MSMTLARRLRRINVLPTTYVEHEERRLAKGEDGLDREVIITIKKAVHHREKLDESEALRRRAEVRTDYRARNREFRQRRRIAQLQKPRVNANAAAPVKSKKKEK